jgi:uncharacterized C2H2 Zn-finger protein
MNICQKCSAPFPNWLKIGGVLKNLHCRKFCLTCSPYKAHNTKNLTITDYKPVFITRDGVSLKLCPTCDQYLEYSTKNFYITGAGKYHHYCKPCGKTRTVERQRDLKRQCIDYKGGKCSVCGYNKYNGSLTFHHLDPSKKEFGIAEGRCYNFEKLKLELEKCILVCRNCHGEIHGGITSPTVTP